MGYRFRFFGELEDKFETNKLLKKGFALVDASGELKVEPTRTTRASKGEIGNTGNRGGMEPKASLRAIKDVMV